MHHLQSTKNIHYMPGSTTERDTDSHLVPNSRNTFKQLLRSDTRLLSQWLHNRRRHVGRRKRVRV